MKKNISLIFTLVLFVLVGCDSAKIEVGVRDGLVYFNDSIITPDIYLIDGKENLKIEDEYLFGKLIDSVEGKSVTMHDDCDCQPVYSLKIKEYSFALHNHGILIKKSVSKNVKHIEYIGFVECESPSMEEMLEVIEEAR